MSKLRSFAVRGTRVVVFHEPWTLALRSQRGLRWSSAHIARLQKAALGETASEVCDLSVCFRFVWWMASIELVRHQ